MDGITRKTLLYKTNVEYGDYTINHVQGCSHGCAYPCYAFMMAKRFGRVKTYEEWCKPRIVENAEKLLRQELPLYKDKIESVHLCFTTDPFMYGYKEIADLSLNLMRIINDYNIKCTALTKGILPAEIALLNKKNEVGITLVSLDEDFRQKYEPGAANYNDRVSSLFELHKKGIKTWVSIEPYPTPNICKQDFSKILERISFVDKIIFGKLNYNNLVTSYKEHKEFYNKLAMETIDFCKKNNKEWHIKKNTITEIL